MLTDRLINTVNGKGGEASLAVASGFERQRRAQYVLAGLFAYVVNEKGEEASLRSPPVKKRRFCRVHDRPGTVSNTFACKVETEDNHPDEREMRQAVEKQFRDLCRLKIDRVDSCPIYPPHFISKEHGGTWGTGGRCFLTRGGGTKGYGYSETLG